MHGYTKLFESILTSTIWDEDEKTRIVWITMLALKNSRHMVEASVPGLARLARVDVEATRRALAKFQQADPDSRTKDFDGRRIEERDGGWFILNGAKYDAKCRASERTEYMREYMAGRRAKKTEDSQPPSAADFSEPPTDADFMAFCKSWPGDMARGIPEGIPEGWAMDWLAWKMGDAKPFPRDWQRVVSAKFSADWLNHHPKARPETKKPRCAGPNI